MAQSTTSPIGITTTGFWFFRCLFGSIAPDPGGGKRWWEGKHTQTILELSAACAGLKKILTWGCWGDVAAHREVVLATRELQAVVRAFTALSAKAEEATDKTCAQIELEEKIAGLQEKY